MEATELIELIRTSEKKTPVRVVLQANAPCEFPGAEVFSGGNGLHILYGDWKTLGPQLTAQAAHIDRLHVENGACNSAIPMLDLKGLHARVEPGAIIREGAEIGANAVVLQEAPPDSTVVGIKARVVKIAGQRVGPSPAYALDQINLPDPLAQELCRLQNRVYANEQKLKKEEEREREADK